MRARIAIVDDRPLVRAGIVASIAVRVVGEYATSAEATARLSVADPTVTIVRSVLPDGSGLELCRNLRRMLPANKTLVIFPSLNRQDLIAAIDSGAAYLCAETTPIQQLSEIVASLDADEPMLNGASLARLAAELDTGADQVLVERFATLSGTQKAIATRVATGASNDVIAEELGLATQTVKNQMTAMLAKLGVDNRTQLAIFVASQSGVRR